MLVVHAEFQLEKLKGRCQFEDVSMGGGGMVVVVVVAAILQLFFEE